MKRLIYPFGILRVFLNLKCNVSCGYCSMKFQPELWKGDDFEEASPDQWIRAFERLDLTRKHSVVSFCNAEPAVYEGCADIINCDGLKDEITQMYTNLSSQSMIEIRKMVPRNNLDFYVSYHRGQVPLDEFIANAQELQSKFRVINFHAPMYPPFKEKIMEDIAKAAEAGVNIVNDHEFFGVYKDEMHWQYLKGGDWIKNRFAHRLEGKPKRKVLCKTSVDQQDFFSRAYTVAPDGDFYTCWRYLYAKDEKGVLGNFFDEEFTEFKDEYFECEEYGDCHFCAWHKNIKDAETGEQLDIDVQTPIGDTISACMIVKNEEENLPRCLESLKGWVDELVLVDTGSTDKTIDVAMEFFDDFPEFKLKKFKWDDDFSAARNFSISQATKDWIFIVDADEVIGSPDGVALKNLLKDNKPLCVGVDVLNMYKHPNDGEAPVVKSALKSIRVFQRQADLEYTGRVHNELVIPAGAQILNIPFRLYHYGYDLSPEQMAKKVERMIRMTKRKTEEEPDNPASWYHYVRALKTKDGQFNKEAGPEMVAALKRGLSLYKGEGGFAESVYIQLLTLMATIQYALGDTNECLKYAKKALAIKPDYLDAIWLVAVSYAYGIDAIKGEEWVLKYLREQEVYDFSEKIDCISMEHANERANAYRVLTDIEMWKQQQYLNSVQSAPVQ